MSDFQHWYYINSDYEEDGPVSSDDLRKMAGSGDIHRGTYVWTQELEEWVPASKVGGLFKDQKKEVVKPLSETPVAKKTGAFQVTEVKNAGSIVEEQKSNVSLKNLTAAQRGLGALPEPKPLIDPPAQAASRGSTQPGASFAPNPAEGQPTHNSALQSTSGHNPVPMTAPVDIVPRPISSANRIAAHIPGSAAHAMPAPFTSRNSIPAPGSQAPQHTTANSIPAPPGAPNSPSLPSAQPPPLTSSNSIPGPASQPTRLTAINPMLNSPVSQPPQLTAPNPMLSIPAAQPPQMVPASSTPKAIPLPSAPASPLSSPTPIQQSPTGPQSGIARPGAAGANSIPAPLMRPASGQAPGAPPIPPNMQAPPIPARPASPVSGALPVIPPVGRSVSPFNQTPTSALTKADEEHPRDRKAPRKMSMEP